MKPASIPHKPQRHRSAFAFSALIALALLLAACSTPAPAAAPPTAAAQSTAASSPADEMPQAVEQEVPASSPTPAALQPAPESLPAPTPAAAPACAAPAALTPALTEGPYFTPNSPERASLVEPGMQGTQLVLTGYVLTADCQPVANALLDFWQADAAGVYDNVGYTLRGHQFSDENGYYRLVTVVPGQYPGRTEHIHFKVQAPGGPVLTSQLFFPGSTSNDGDRIYDPGLLINISESGEGLQATFNFIINR